MRILLLIFFCAIIATTFAEPEPKKYKVDSKKQKTVNTSLTDEERKFLRDVEAKFNVKTESKDKKKIEVELKNVPKTDGKLPFPAVIAIEIVNDTDSKGKGKRTIDANLGYGYKTNSGYSYSYFGKPTEDQGKFMIYPYSQEDIPPTKGHTSITNVEIQPSRAFELVTVNDEKEGYDYPKPKNEFKTNYDNVKGLVSPPPSYADVSHSHGQAHAYVPSTLYTTYNGHELSGLSGNFPTVMPNYFVDPSQLLKNPEYQNVGLTNEHLRHHGSNIEDQRVVPVLVLRIPSSSLRNPTAELFANLPSNYPLSRYLNNVNLQDLVNQYFKKIGYSVAPQVTSYRDTLLPSHGSFSTGSHSNYRQHFPTPYFQPAYTQSAHSGVQYSAVQPVMAKYPSSYTHHSTSHGHSMFQAPHQHKFEQRYKYLPQTALPQTYYVQPQHHNSHESISHETHSHIPSEVQYDTVPQVSHQETHTSDSETYHHAPQVSHEAAKLAYDFIKNGNIVSSSPAYDSVHEPEPAQEYYTHNDVQKETLAIIPEQYSQEPHHSEPEVSHEQKYHYQQQSDDEDNHGLTLSENYPSKDHTIATVLPVSYTQSQNTGAIQTVSYVTPMPYSSKYRSPYNIMVPKTFLTNPSTEKVMYVDSHSVSAFSQNYHQHYNPEAEYTLGPQHVPPIGKQKAPSYPRNYHSHPKRMAKPEKRDSIPMHSRKIERVEKKKSS